MFEQIIAFIRNLYGQSHGRIGLHEPVFAGNERRCILDAIDSTFVSSVGEYVDRLEAMICELTSAGHAVATVNGTAALQVALKLAGVEEGDAVITQPLTFVATANAVNYLYAEPIFVDVDRETLGLSPAALAAYLDEHAERDATGQCRHRSTGRRIAAVMPMHTFGHPVRIQETCAIASRWNLPVVEDAAEALGSTRGGRHCGTFGALGVFSFNGNKIVTAGGGGAIVTDDADLARRAKHLTTTAKIPHPYEYVHDAVGYNFRMPNLNAALACAQVEALPQILEDKRATAQAYAEFFEGVDNVTFIRQPEGCQSNCWLNAVILADRDERDAFLRVTNEAGIVTRPIWRLMNELPMYADCPCGPLEQARWLEDRVVNIPSSMRGTQ
jgi:aminotransferase in exopolysaccharide biosynthesis